MAKGEEEGVGVEGFISIIDHQTYPTTISEHREEGPSRERKAVKMARTSLRIL
jgi:hypothetical protein